MTDILDDLKKRLLEIGLNAPVIEKVVMETRADWAGERPYIHYEYTNRKTERNMAIIREHKAALQNGMRYGESISRLKQKYKLSRQRVEKIIKG